jgi:hypothetical protein
MSFRGSRPADELELDAGHDGEARPEDAVTVAPTKES